MRPRTIAAIAAGGTLAALTVAYGVALQADLGRFKPAIAEAAREATGRDLVIGGKLRLAPGLRPALVLEDVTLSNADWAAEPSLFRARRVTVAVKVLPLLSGRIELARVDIAGAEIFLETNAQGAPNWLFDRDGESVTETTPEEAAAAVPGAIVVHDAVVSFRDGQRGGEPLTLVLRRAEVRDSGPGPGPEQGLSADADLTFRGADVAVAVELPAVADLIANRPGAIRLEAASGGATLTVEGSVTDWRSGAGIDIAIRGEGPDAARLAGLAGSGVAIEGPFEFAARLSDNLADETGSYVLSGIRARLGGYSLGGEASLDAGVSPVRVALDLDLSGGGVTGKVSLAARGDGPFELLGTLAGSFEFVRPGGPGVGVSVKGAIRHTAEARTPTTIEASGDVGGQDLSLTARFGPLDALGTSTPVTFDITLDMPDTRFAFKGLVRDLFGEARISAAFEFESGDLGVLARAFGATAPSRGARAAGRVEGAGSRIILTGLEAAIGGSDLRGEVTIETDGPRPRILADLASRRLDTGDLAPAPDEESADSEPDRDTALSEEPLPFDVLRRFDAVVRYRGDDVTANGVALGRVSFALALEDGDLKFDELEAAPSGVPLSGTLSLSTGADTPEFHLTLSGGQVDFGPALEERGVRIASAGAESIEVELSARGDSPRALAESLQGEVRVAGLSLRPRSDAAGADVALDLRLSLRGADSAITMNGEGTLGGEALTLSASLPSIDALRRGAGAKASFEARAGEGFLTLEAEILGGDVTELKLDSGGPLLRDLARFAGLSLAGAGPYSLKGVLRAGPERYELRSLTFASGQTDLSAEGTLARGVEKTEFDFHLTSANFDLDDLVAAGAGTENGPGAAAADADERPLPLGLLRGYEGALTVGFGEVRLRAIRFSDLSVRATLADGILDIPEFSALVGGAPLTGRASLAVQDDAAGGDSVKLRLGFAGTGIDPGAVLTDPRIAETLTTTMDVDINLQAEGATRGELIASLSGRMQVIAGVGRFEETKYLFFETGILRQLAPWEERRDATTLNCLVADFVVENGVAAANGLLLDTEFMSVLGSGEIDLGAGTLDLTFSPRPKETRLLDLAIPVHLGGTFAEPTFLPTPGGVTKKVATTLGALVNPLVLLVPVIEGVRADKNPCVEALARAAADVDPNAEKDTGIVEGVVEGVVSGVEGVVGGVLKGIGGVLKRLGGEE